MAITLLKHDRIGCLDSIHNATQVHIQNPVPVVDFIESYLATNSDARVIEQVVQATMTRKRILDQTVDGSEVRDVDLHGKRTAAGLANSGCNLLGKNDLAVGERDMSAQR